MGLFTGILLGLNLLIDIILIILAIIFLFGGGPDI